jgi:glycosyltransferase involved in cell wall biosynthesis
MKISVIIPTLDNPSDVYDVIESLNRQLLLPSEVVIVDSSSNDDIDNLLKTINSVFPITYIRFGRAYKYDRLIKFFKNLPLINSFFRSTQKGRAYPYEATNKGASIAKHEWLAFLDATTIPSHNWIKDYVQIIHNYEAEVVFGKTLYLADTFFQKILRASTYGANGIETAPGSFMKKNNFLDGFQITEGVRSGGDVDWKNRVRENFKSISPKDSYLLYPNLHKDLYSCIKKFFIYQMHTAVQDIAHSIKDLYFLLTLMFGLILIPKWNAIVGWEASSYYMPHITKIYLLSATLILLFSLILNRIFAKQSSKPFLQNAYKISFFILISFGVYNWNSSLAGWVEESVWYIPHVTKIFIIFLCLASFAYRGLYFPIKNNIAFDFLFPINWICVGLLGLILDIVKAPGYLIGALISPFVKVIRSPSNKL